MIKYIFKIMIAPNVIDFEAIITPNFVKLVEYKIVKDFAGLYEEIFSQVLKGEFSMQYIENNELKEISFDSKIAPLGNIFKFCALSKKLFGFEATIELDTNHD